MKIKNATKYLGETIFIIGLGLFVKNILSFTTVSDEGGVAHFYLENIRILIMIGIMMMTLGIFLYINKIISEWRSR